MTELFELRVVENFASKVFRPNEGTKLSSGIIRLVKLDGDDSRLSEIGRLHKHLQQEQQKSFFFGWEIIRSYSAHELDTASLLQLKINSTFEPAGEESGTEYDESTSCSRCGAGAQQITPLCLPGKRIPKSKDISQTIAGEIVVSRRVVELFARHRITGAKFIPVRLNRSSSAESKDWFQLIPSSTNAEIAAPTRVGIDPFTMDETGQYRCSCGDLIGLNLLSEVSIKLDSRGDADIFCSRQFIGIRRGLLRPDRIIFISPKARLLMESEKLKGVQFELAHTV